MHYNPKKEKFVHEKIEKRLKIETRSNHGKRNKKDN